MLPVIGTKELIAWLPTLLGCGPGDAVSFPELAYPTYDIGARLAGAQAVATDEPGPRRRRAGEAGLAELAVQPDRPGAARRPGCASSWPGRGRLGRRARLRRVLHRPRVRRRAGVGAAPRRSAGRSHDGLLAVYSLSKRSNLAGYRAGFVAGDPALVAALLEVRKHAGMIVPAPVQAAMTAALGDDSHAAEQHARYARRRGGAAARARAGRLGRHRTPRPACTCGRRTRTTTAGSRSAVLSEIGILVSPGEFYGRAGSGHIRVALTATDERIAAAAARLARPRLARRPPAATGSRARNRRQAPICATNRC